MSLTILQRTTAQSISDSTWTLVSWSSAITDPVAAWSSGSPTIVTTPSGAAFVDVLLYLCWGDNANNSRRSRIYINSTVQEYHHYPALDRCPHHHPTRRYAVSAGDTLKVEVWQNTGGALNFYDSLDGSFTPTVQFRWWT